MAAPKPSYRTELAAEEYLSSEGFIWNESEEEWVCDMSNDGGGKVVAIVAWHSNMGEYVIRHWDEE